ncbi:uncharacterized protein LOC102077748 isoform X3 [Oreochromis niloticus]|uniref:uncharacterized protein LOC102077748 isoform X3 n=1 Tax=Oreochromis niloticus TaxID=8128 RepID=UPI000904891C|nr:uncharacterized protein LOC102077748 isoform X3 [Oreochromis niloticus]
MGKAKMKTKWLQDSSPESLQHLPEKTPSTSGFQHRRPKAANQEINTGQPVRSSSPQPSTSGLHLNRDWRTRRSRPQASTSGFKRGREEADQEEVHPGRRVRRSSPRPSTSGFQRGRQTSQAHVVPSPVFYLFFSTVEERRLNRKSRNTKDSGAGTTESRLTPMGPVPPCASLIGFYQTLLMMYWVWSRGGGTALHIHHRWSISHSLKGSLH